MAFVPQFKNDIFVSYAHVDDVPLPGAETGWVTTIVSYMKTRMAQKLGRRDSCAVWMDHELSSHQKVTSQLIETVRDTAILVVVLSPGYVASEWCQRERATFLKSLREYGGSRVFVVERDLVEDAIRPHAFRDLRTFRFWVKDRPDRPARILGSPRPSPNDEQYYDSVEDLCVNLERALRALRQASPIADGAHRARSTAIGEPTSPLVFLAEVTDDLEQDRLSIRRYLEQAGIGVLPQNWYSLEPPAFKDAAERDIAECDLFVQLLSEFSGRKPPSLRRGYAWLQFDLAVAAEKPVLQWRRPELDPDSVEDPDHRELLQAVTVQAEGLEDFKCEIKERLLREPTPEPPRPISAFVFVDMEATDRLLAEQVCQLLDEAGAEYILPVHSEDPAENRKDLQRNLRTCDAVVVVYGESTVTWVRGQLLESRKILASRERPLKALAVFEGPPEQKDRLDLKLRGLQILNCRKGLSERAVREFLGGIVKEDRS